LLHPSVTLVDNDRIGGSSGYNSFGAENDHFPCRYDAVASPMSYYTHFVRNYDGKTGDYGLSREKKMHDVS